jgi:predicted PurR-regulated permease PerM
LSGLLMYELARSLANRIKIARIRRAQGRLIAVVVLVTVLIALSVAAGLGAAAAYHSVTTSLPNLLQRMADIIDNLRFNLPASVVAQLPAGVEELKVLSTTWLRDHAGTLGHFGLQAGRILVHLLIGPRGGRDDRVVRRGHVHRSRATRPRVARSLVPARQVLPRRSCSDR